MRKPNFFVGKTLTGIKVAKDREAMLFQTTEGDHVVRVDGDCCSQTWVENIEAPALGFPATVLAVEDLDMGESTVDESWRSQDIPPITGHKPSKHHEGGEVIAYYGCKITTDRGEIVIDYRNDSNGYYGGNICWPDEDYYYGGVYGQNVSANEWTDL